MSAEAIALSDGYHWTPVRNDSGESIPDFALMKVTGAVKVNGQRVVTVDKPDGSGSQFLINDGFEIPSDSGSNFGRGTRSFGKSVLYDDGATPAAGDDWGPVSGSWELTESGTGIEIVGDAADGRVRVLFPGGGGGGGAGPTHTHHECLITTDIPAATFDDSDPKTKTPGECFGYLYQYSSGTGVYELQIGDTPPSVDSVTSIKTSGATDELDIDIPADVEAGDLLLLFAYGHASPDYSSFADPSGEWTQEFSDKETDDDRFLEVHSKQADYLEGGETITVTFNQSHDTYGVTLLVVKNSFAIGDLSSDQETATSPAVDTVEDDSLVMRAAVAIEGSASWSLPAGYDSHLEEADVGTGNVTTVAICSEVQGTAGDSGTETLEYDSAAPLVTLTLAIDIDGRIKLFNTSMAGKELEEGKGLNGRCIKEGSRYTFTLRDCEKDAVDVTGLDHGI